MSFLTLGYRSYSSLDQIREACSAGADIYAVSFRVSMLNALKYVHADRLAPWTMDDSFNDRVFDLFAKMPMEWIPMGVRRQGFPFDADAFFQQLSSED